MYRCVGVGEGVGAGVGEGVAPATRLDLFNFCCAWPFLTLADFKLYFVTIIERITIRFGMMDK